MTHTPWAQSIFYILYPKSQNGMARVTFYSDGSGKIEYMLKNNIVSSPMFEHSLNTKTGVLNYKYKNKPYHSPIWYRSFGSHSALTAKFERKTRKVKAT